MFTEKAEKILEHFGIFPKAEEQALIEVEPNALYGLKNDSAMVKQ